MGSNSNENWSIRDLANRFDLPTHVVRIAIIQRNELAAHFEFTAS